MQSIRAVRHGICLTLSLLLAVQAFAADDAPFTALLGGGDSCGSEVRLLRNSHLAGHEASQDTDLGLGKYQPQLAASLGDINKDGRDDLALFARAKDGAVRIRLHDGRAGWPIRQFRPEHADAFALHCLRDALGSGEHALAVFTRRVGNVQVVVYDLDGNQHTRHWLPGSGTLLATTALAAPDGVVLSLLRRNLAAHNRIDTRRWQRGDDPGWIHRHPYRAVICRNQPLAGGCGFRFGRARPYR